ncbi:hypothetical protein Agub_g6693, partial [Astrephomene gubernaculifera]
MDVEYDMGTDGGGGTAAAAAAEKMGYSGRWLAWRCVRRGYDRLDVVVPYILTLPPPPGLLAGGEDDKEAAAAEEVGVGRSGAEGQKQQQQQATRRRHHETGVEVTEVVQQCHRWLRSLQAALEWTSWALEQGIVSLADLPELVEKARTRVQAATIAAAAAAADSRMATAQPPLPCSALPETLLDFLCLLPPVEEAIPGRQDNTTTAAADASGGATAAPSWGSNAAKVGSIAGGGDGGLPPACRDATRDLCLALLRLMQQLAEAEHARREESQMAESGLCDSEALIPWSDKDAVNVCLAAALAPHVLGVLPADVVAAQALAAAASALTSAVLRAKLPYGATLEAGLRELLRRTLGGGGSCASSSSSSCLAFLEMT